MISLSPLFSMFWAQKMVTDHHYLHAPVDVRTMPEGYAVWIDEWREPVGVLLFGRPEATRCYPWYGGLPDVAAGRAEVTRWQVLNLSRVWLDSIVQPGGLCYGPQALPGFMDRRGVWRSTLASTVLRMASAQIGFQYLLRRPPCFLNEPYEIKWLLSYCDTRLHRGTIYAASGFELYRTNGRGIQTYRIRLPGLTPAQDAAVREASEFDARARRFRADRARVEMQLSLGVS